METIFADSRAFEGYKNIQMEIRDSLPPDKTNSLLFKSKI